MIYGSKHGKYWFLHIFHCNFTTMVSTEVKLWFLSSLEHFWPDPKGALSKVALFFEKMHKVFKNKAQRCSTPLIGRLLSQCCSFWSFYKCTHIFTTHGHAIWPPPWVHVPLEKLINYHYFAMLIFSLTVISFTHFF